MGEVPRPEHPRPGLIRPSWLNLNGGWLFGIGEGEPEEEITVPFPPESELSGIGNTDFMPLVKYARTFDFGLDSAGKRVLLHFGAVDFEARAWLNGSYLGKHVGGYSPFSFEVTDDIIEGENLLSLEVRDDNRTGLQPCGKQSTRPESYGCRYTRVTGIWQPVWLEVVGKHYIDSVTVGRPRDGQNIWAMVDLIGRADRGTIELEVSIDGEIVGRGKAPASLHTKIPIEMGEPELWGPGNPNLYDVNLILRSGDAVVDGVESYFGLRSISVQGDSMLINGERVFQRLVLDQGYYPDGIYTARTDADLRHDIEISMEMGFNGARLHQKVFEPRFLYWADRLGYMVWGEYPSWGMDIFNTEACNHLISEWSDVVRRDLNHPSIIGWCPFNETPRDQNVDLIKAVYELTRQLDPGRPVIDTSGYTHVVTDVYDSHDYDQDPVSFRERHRAILDGGTPYQNHPEDDAEYAGQPVMVSEFGGTWWNPGQAGEDAWGYGDRPRTVEEFLVRYRALVKALLENPKMSGFCYTQLYDIEQEVNGLNTYAREAKFDPSVIRDVNTAPATYEDRE
jgi:beta-galactosidase/beta-glucuronidase